MNRSSVSEKKQVFLPRNFIKVLILLLILLGVCMLASLAFGSRMVDWTDVLDGLFHQTPSLMRPMLFDKELFELFLV